MHEAPTLSTAGVTLLETARRFRREQVAPHAGRWERERSVPRETLRAAARLGLTGIEVPPELGGQGAGFLAKTRIAEEISRSCMAFAFSLINTQNAAARIARHGSKAQIERYLAPLIAGERIGCTALTEPQAGSDFPAIATTAQRAAGGWIINGEKAWLTNAAIADVITLYAKTDVAAAGAGIAAFLVDTSTPGVERVGPYAMIGGHAIGAGGVKLSDVRVGDDALFYPPGEAFKRALDGINGARTYVAAMCCGMVAESLGIALDYAQRRHTFGKRLLEHQGLRWSLVEIATDLEAARRLTYRAAELIEHGEDAVLAAAMAKKFAVRMAQQRLGDCMQAMGAEGLRENHPIGRHIACARIAGYVDGSSEMMNERIGALLERAYLGADAP